MKRTVLFILTLFVVAVTPAAAEGDAPLNLAPPVRTISVYDHVSGEIFEAGLEEYIVSVLAGEMPVSYELEALKAQAVAARTYTVSKLPEYGGSGCRSNRGADVCTNSACCQSYKKVESLREAWGDEADEKLDKLRRAVHETSGELVTYMGEPIEAMYHASSGGHTEDVELVYAQALPYLRGVVSEGEQDAPQYRSSKVITASELSERLGVALAEDRLSDEIAVLSRSDTGRVVEISVGGVVFTGTEFRRKSGLRSSNFTMEFEDGSIRFDILGFGHGVGMSQTGANAMAGRGYNYREILTWYYTGTEVSRAVFGGEGGG